MEPDLGKPKINIGSFDSHPPSTRLLKKQVQQLWQIPVCYDVSFGIDLEEIAFVGDDLPDLAVIRRVGLGITPANGNHIVASQALWQTKKGGGQGAVREVAELILNAQGKLEALLAPYQ